MLDNAPGHPTDLDELNDNMKVVFLPKNTTSLLQPMDQGAIRAFKAYYTKRTLSRAVRATEDGVLSLKQFWKDFNIYDGIKHVDDAWHDVSDSTMKNVWNKLCPQYAHTHKGFTSDDLALSSKALDDLAKIRRDTVDLGQQLELEMDESDVEELLDSHDKELSTEELLEIEKELENEEKEPESEEMKKFTLKDLSSAFNNIEKALMIFEDQDINTERFTKVYRGVMAQLECYRTIYDEKKKKAIQPKIHAYFKATTPATTPARISTPASPTPGTSTGRDTVPARTSTPASPTPGTSTGGYTTPARRIITPARRTRTPPVPATSRGYSESDDDSPPASTYETSSDED